MNTIEDAETLRHVRTLADSGAARAIRETSGLSRSEVAQVVGVHPSTIWRWEDGSRTPRGDAALRWGRLLDRLRSGGRK